MLRISTTRKVWDFDFLRGLAPGPLDELSIEKESESFSHSPGKFEGGAMRFFCGGGGGGGGITRGNHPALEQFKKLASTFVLLLRGTVNSELEIFKIAQKPKNDITPQVR